MLHKLPSLDSDCAMLPICVFKGWHENCLKEYLLLSFMVFILLVTATLLRFFFLKQIFIKKRQTNLVVVALKSLPFDCLTMSYDPALTSSCSSRSVLGWIVRESTAGGSGDRLFSRPYSSLYSRTSLKYLKYICFTGTIIKSSYLLIPLIVCRMLYL